MVSLTFAAPIIAHLRGRQSNFKESVLNEPQGHQFSAEVFSFYRAMAAKGCRRDERLSIQSRTNRRRFIWHDHQDTDETFIVLEGKLRIDFREGSVNLSAGEMFVVPKGIEHKPFADGEVKLLLIEPRGVTNTGHETSDRTAQNDVWI